MDINDIKAQLADFKAIKTKGSITPESLGTMLENMFATTEELGNLVFGQELKGTATLGSLYCNGNEAAPIQAQTGTGYYRMSNEIIHLKAGQHLHISAYQLPGVLAFVSRYEEGAMSLGAWSSESPYNIDYTATEDVDVVIAMSNGISTVQSTEYTISQEPLLNRIIALEQTVAAIPEPEAPFTTLDVNVFESKTKFVNNEQFNKVWSAMQQNTEIAVAIRVNYASGTSVLFHATCVKPNYISLHAKAGSCELHLASDGTFTISGTSLW